MKKLAIIVGLIWSATAILAQSVKATWEFSDKEQLSSCAIAGEESYTSLLTSTFLAGSGIDQSRYATMTGSNAAEGYQAVTYTPPFTQVYVTTQVSGRNAGHCISFGVTPANGHKFKPTKISLDVAKCGTDAGNIDITVKPSGGTETAIATGIAPLRNKIQSGNETGYSHLEYNVNNQLVDSKMFVLLVYVYNIAGTDASSPKSMAFRNITIEGVMDEEEYTTSHYIDEFTCQATTPAGQTETIDLMSLVKDLKYGESTTYGKKVTGDPTDFAVTAKEGYTASVSLSNDHVATLEVKQGNDLKFLCSVRFYITAVSQKGEAKPLNRGLMALHTDQGNLVSWRSRKTDHRNYQFKLWKGNSAETQTTKINNGNLIGGKTNYLDGNGTAANYYKLEVYDEKGELIETEVSKKTWDNQTLYITLEGGAPKDPTSAGATYTPNDASYCDMDGDGEYEIILKWAPSNEKDAASSGTTSPAFYSCYKLNGTRLWMMHTGANMFNSAHTTPFIAWDFDGDGYGEFMVKTAPGAIDGEGNYVLMGNDSPTENLKSGRGKQDHGGEYITVFDGMTGAELATIAYHTNYAAGQNYWGDSNQNRSERYLAAIAWLDGDDHNPSPIFARGYYSGAFVAAYDWDGTTLKERWVSRNTTSGKGLWGEGAHWISVGDCDGDGKHEIVYGSAALDHDGSLLYRTGLGHGDALHLGDFNPENPGLEVYMTHEKSPYGADLRDAKTGRLLQHPTAGGDTGRGLIAHFNGHDDGAYYQHSASAALYNWRGEVVKESVSHGGGGSLNNRIFWTGSYADCYYDKSVLEAYNDGFGRIQVNGGNYTIGNLNNGSKYNPCVLGDLLGDWREEIVTWTGDETSGFKLIINATNYKTDFIQPHLMDDSNYRAQVINQNCAYNQPPHVSYNPREYFTIKRNPFEVENSNPAAEGIGRYWDCLYTTYAVVVPEGVKAWAVKEVNETDNLLVLTPIPSGKILPAGSSVIYNTDQSEVKFKPTGGNGNITVSSKCLTGSYVDTELHDTPSYTFYEFRDGDRGLGLYRANGKTIEGGTGYGKVMLGEADSFVLPNEYNPSITAIENLTVRTQGNAETFDLEGRATDANAKGLLIREGRIVLIK